MSKVVIALGDTDILLSDISSIKKNKTRDGGGFITVYIKECGYNSVKYNDYNKLLEDYTLLQSEFRGQARVINFNTDLHS